MVEPKAKFYNNQMCLADLGVIEVRLDQPFRILVSNFGEQLINILPKQLFATANPHPANLVE